MRCSLTHVSKTFVSGGQKVLSDVSLEVCDGELMVFVGPSGCGKSTTLRCIAGLEEIDSGQIHIGARNVTDLNPRDRDVAMVFQNYALYPHLSVRGNLEFGLRQRRVPAAEIRERVRRAVETLQIGELIDRRPNQLSGGQQQRAAIGRALVRQATVFLLDEPLSNLDAHLRVQMRTEIKGLQRQLGLTTIFVTHDQEEALSLGDRVAVLREGRVEQVDEPLTLYNRPKNAFVARFIGSPPMNILRAAVSDGSILFGGQSYRLNAVCRDTLTAGPILVGVRPEALRIGVVGEGLKMMVSVVEQLGARTRIAGHLADESDQLATMEIPSAEAVKVRVADTLNIQIEAKDFVMFDIRTEERVYPK